MSDYQIPSVKDYSENYSYGYKNPYLKKKTGLTDSQRELLPYIQEQRMAEEKKNSLWQPLELIFDILRRGQYASANVAQDIAGGGNPLEGLWKGITGERKGSWKTTLFGGQDEGSRAFAGIAPQAQDSILKKKFDIPILSAVFGPTTGEDLIGMVGDIFFDPSTYISFGATAASKAAAARVAKFTVQNMAKGVGNIKNLSGFVREGFKPEYFQKLLYETKGGAEKAGKYLEQHLEPKAMNRFMEETYNKAFKDALKSTPQQVQEKFISGLAEDKGRYIEDASAYLAGKGKKVAKEFTGALQGQDIQTLQKLIDISEGKRFNKLAATGAYKELLGEIGGKAIGDVPGKAGGVLQNLMDYSMKAEEIGGKEFLGELRGLGERGMSFMGKEFFKSTRQPWIVSKTWDAFKEYVGKIGIGNATLGNAAYAILNTGPVGQIRKLLGFRNPYQQMLRGIEMSGKHAYPYMADQEMNKVNSALEGVDDDILNKTFFVKAEAHEARTAPEMILANKNVLSRYKIDEKDIPQIQQAIINLKSISDEWNAVEIEKGITHKYIMNYLPQSPNQVAPYLKKSSRITGTDAPGFTKTQKVGPLTTMRGEKEKFKALLGVDDATAEHMVVNLNWSTKNMNLKQMYLYRAIAHSKAVAAADMVEQFKTFGIRIGGEARGTADFNPADVQMNKDLYTSLARSDADLTKIGLYKGKDERLSDYFFDKDVADIVNRALAATSSDDALKGFQKFMNNTSAYWRAVATFTPGFTIRNAKSNTMTGFLNYGPSFLNPKLAVESWVITAHGLGMDDWIAKKFNMKPEVIQRILAKDYNGMSGAEVAEYLSRNGMISQGSMMYDIPSTVKKASGEPNKDKFNITSTENVLFQGSRTINSVVESTPKVTGFILERLKMAGKEQATEAMNDAALLQIKKLWFDYSDLEEAEKMIFKNLFPFYTWLRKNMALQIDQMLTNPMYKNIPKIEEGFSEQLTPDEEMNLPGYMKEQDWAKIGEGESGPRMLHYNMPWEDLNKIPISIGFSDTGMPELSITARETWDEVQSMTSPILKSFAAIATGKDPFRKKDLEADAPAPRVMRFLAAQPQMLGVVDGLLKFFGNPKGLGVTKGEKGELNIDGKIQYLLEANFPLLNRIDQLGDTITEFFPQIERGVADLTGYEKGYDKMANTFKVMSYALGITQKDVDTDQQELYRYREMLREAEKRRAADRALLPGQQKRTNDYLRKERERMKKLGLVR